MRLEGTLDAFSLPDVFQLLSYTRKTGTLHLRRAGQHGAIHLRDGAVTGARSDVRRQALGRRLVGAGLVDDAMLADAVEELVETPEGGLGRALAERAGLDQAAVVALATEQATDAVFELMRWPDGDFAFHVDEADPDDLGASLPVDEVVAEGRRRLEAWASMTAAVPAPDAVVALTATPSAPPVLTLDEWQLLSLVDGRRTVADLVALAGRGDFAIVGALAALVERGLLQVRDGGTDASSAMLRRQQLLAALEGIALPPEPEAATSPAAADLVPAARAEPAGDDRSPVLPDRPEPFGGVRTPDHPDGAVQVRAGGSGPVALVDGSSALALDVAPAPRRDPAIDRTLLLRLIAGVRGL